MTKSGKVEEYFEIQARKTGGPYKLIGTSKDASIADSQGKNALRGRYKSYRIFLVKKRLITEKGREDNWICANCGSTNAMVEKTCNECS